MKIIVVNNYEEMSERAAEIFAGVINNKPDAVLGLATGDTPLGLYENLAKKYKYGELDFSRVKSVNLDEYYPIDPENDQSYRYFMNKNFFSKININLKNTYVPDGSTKKVEAFCHEYESIIDSLGGIDIQILGIGRNGHIGFNEPSVEGLHAYTHLTELTPSTVEANSRFFASADLVPKHAITMGIKSVFKAKKIVLLASGNAKADAIREMLRGRISTLCPASVLSLHQDVTLICDKEAYSKI